MRNRLSFPLQLVTLLVGPLFLALSLFLLPNIGPLPGPAPIQAAAKPSWPQTVIQSSNSYTVYLPIIYRSPTFEEQLVDLINAERAKQGLGTLSINSVLAQVAEAHSQDMIDRNFFDHTNPDGLLPGNRVTNAGYTWSNVGETIGAGYTSPQAMLNGWLNSPGHRAILLGANYTEIGIGYVPGGAYGHYWTAVFARPS